MDVPGRPSAASLSIAPVAHWARIEPPETLTEAQRGLWREIVATKPSEWFKADCAPLLEAYCKAITHYRHLAAMLDEPPADLKELKALTTLAKEQAGLMKDLATKLRLTPQSRYTPQAAATANKKAATQNKPWQS